MLSWHIITSEEYRLGKKVEGDLYFLSDTKEFYRGTQSFSEACVLYWEEPAVKAIGKLYFDANTLEGKTWDGESWTTLIKPLADVVDAESENGVTAKALVAYVAQEIAKVPTVENAIIDLAWDAESSTISYTQNGEPKTILLKGVGVGLKSSAEGTKTNISLLDVEGNPIGNTISLDLERFVTGAKYDPEKKSIFLYFDGKEGEESTDYLEIPVADLVDTYTVESGKTLTLEISDENVIKGEVKISEQLDNAIIVKPDGLYVPAVDVSDKMDLVEEATEGNIAVYGTGGQVIDSGLTKAGIIADSKIKVYQGASLNQIKTACETTPAEQGDIGIVTVKAPGMGSAVNRKVFIYNNGGWQTLTGNWSTDDVYLSEDLVITSELPGITLTDGHATVAEAGDTLTEVLNKLFKHERAPQIVKPSLKIELAEAGEYEVGSTVTPHFTATLDVGSYEFGPNPTGVSTESWTVTDSNSQQLNTNTGSFDSITVAEGSNYSITAINQYTEGNVPLTNLGNEYTSGQIKTGTLTAISKNITGYRAAFGGAKSTKGEEVTSEYIRGLDTKTKIRKGGSFNVKVPAGSLRVIIAIPGTFADLKDVRDTNGMNLNIASNFKAQTVSVEGANGYIAVPYKVYVLDMAAATLQDNVFTVNL